MDPEIFDAILIPAGVGDFSGVDGQRIRAAARRLLSTIRHGNTSRLIFGNKHTEKCLQDSLCVFFQSVQGWSVFCGQLGLWKEFSAKMQYFVISSCIYHNM